MSIGRFGPTRVCYSGGGYLRLLPMPMIRHGIHSEGRSGRSTVVYLHPRDFASDCPRAQMSLHRRFKCYVGLSTTKPKLHMLLKNYKWDTCESVLAAALGEDGQSLPSYRVAS